MIRTASIRSRLIVGAAVVLLAFMAVAGYAVQRAHEDSVRSAHFARLQSTVYLLLAGAELANDGRLVMPPSLPEPRLSLPGSGLYAQVTNVQRNEQWRSASSVADLPFPAAGAVGEWHYDTLPGYLAASYTVKWSVGALDAPLSLAVLETRSDMQREAAAFARTLWSWLGGASLLLLVSQTLLLAWGLAPLGEVAHEIRRIESGEQQEVQGRYPAEIEALTANINALLREERVRQTRYREALSFLAHSLKTPLAVLRTGLQERDRLPQTVEEQVARMDDIVQHQLARAASGSGPLFAPPLPLRPVVERIQASLQKVYAEKQLAFTLDCPQELAWRISDGDAFEMFGNLMDNAAKWARGEVRVRLVRDGRVLHASVEDDGPGFSDTRAVLQLHVRGDERVPGHGVGLAVVAELVRSQQGELVLGRSALGGGKVELSLRGG